ncbi:hypothetical protein BC828DRAFT_384873 [Blastocladiella britannica]|nr:hypothetical protein BC828DRAFT_384873 [Blastocladiella britannica]
MRSTIAPQPASTKRSGRPAGPPLDIASASRDGISARLPDGAALMDGIIPHCPVYRPTADQWRDPIAFIATIRTDAERAGICKIIPPKDWVKQVGFALDTTTFRFPTRKQPLAEMDAGARASLNFVETLQKFHALMGHPLTHMPVLQRKPLDLLGLRRAVLARGGFAAVTNGKRWAEVSRSLFSTPFGHNMPTYLRQAYARYILPFDEYVKGAEEGEAADIAAAKEGDSVRQTREAVRAARERTSSVEERLRDVERVVLLTDTNDSSDGNGVVKAPPLVDSGSESATATAASARTSARMRARPSNRIGGPETGLGLVDSKPSITPPPLSLRRSCRGSLALTPTLPCDSGPDDSGCCAPQARGLLPYLIPDIALSTPKAPLPADYIPELGAEHCDYCGHGFARDLLLICNDCGRAAHAYCLTPPLSVHPRDLEEWYCEQCVRDVGKDFGFEEGGEYGLAEFVQHSRAFKRSWFARHGGATTTTSSKSGPSAATEADVEREFWRIVEAPTYTVDPVDVEYGADLHTTVHGSAFPTPERAPTHPLAHHPANLHNLPLAEGSLLPHVRRDISGVVIPWLYIGMTFSTFCWHAEDHALYSVNYQHFGDTKTWYGVPGHAAAAFEQVMRETGPELFERDPDLLFHITTLLSPKRLVENNVPVTGCHQRAGELVVTFPNAYHGGFNQGANCNEAVNFAPPDWVPWGRQCVERYAAFGKSPCFSHDELLATVALAPADPRPGQSDEDALAERAQWLHPHLEELLDRCSREWDEVCMRTNPAALGLEDVLDPWVLEVATDATAVCSDQCTECAAFCWYVAVECSAHDGGVRCLKHAEVCCTSAHPTPTTANLVMPAEAPEAEDRMDVDPPTVVKSESSFSNGGSTFAPSATNHTKHAIVRYKLPDLAEIVRNVGQRANQWQVWTARVQGFSATHAACQTRPSLRDLSDLLVYAARIPRALDPAPAMYHELLDHVARVVAWTEAAAKWLKALGPVRNTGGTGKRPPTSAAPNTMTTAAATPAAVRVTAAEVLAMRDAADALYVETTETKAVLALADTIDALGETGRQLVARIEDLEIGISVHSGPPATKAECLAYLADAAAKTGTNGTGVATILVPEVEHVESLVPLVDWRERAQQLLAVKQGAHQQQQLQELETLIAEADGLDLQTLLDTALDGELRDRLEEIKLGGCN